VYLSETKVTEAGVKKFAAALPKCRIEWDGGVIEPTMDSPDREVVAWVLSRGGKVGTVRDGQYVTIQDADEIPSEQFTLESVNLAGIKDVGDTDMKRITALSGLKGVYLQETSITDAGLAELAGLQSLTELHLQETQVTDLGLKHLSRLKTLQLLHLHGTKITDAGIVTLTELKELKRLYLDSTETTDKGLKSLHNLKLLRHLTLKGTKVTNAGIEAVRQTLPQCKIEWDGGVIEPTMDSPDPDRRVAEWALSLGGSFDCKNRGRLITVDDAKDLPTEPFKIEKLELPGGRQVTDADIAKLKTLTGLHSLYLHGTGITDAAIADLAKIPGIRTLSLTNSRMTDQGVKQLSDIKGLEAVHLTGSKITDAGLKPLTELPNLRRLNLNHTQVTDEGLKTLHALKQLDWMLLVGTEVTEAGVAQLHQALPNCRITWDKGEIEPQTPAKDAD
jgi:Leucine-rich repeat (LRR) protein